MSILIFFGIYGSIVACLGVTWGGYLVGGACCGDLQ
jgi:hypothetical protein